MTITPNVGSTDKIIRIAIGAILILLALFGIIGWWAGSASCPSPLV